MEAVLQYSVLQVRYSLQHQMVYVAISHVIVVSQDLVRIEDMFVINITAYSVFVRAVVMHLVRMVITVMKTVTVIMVSVYLMSVLKYHALMV